MSIIHNGHVIAGAPGPSLNRYTSDPAMDGTPSPGASGQYADGAHVHPHDTTKPDKTDLTDIVATGSTNGTGGTISAGTFFYLNGALVVAKTDIASGATFTSGTNYEAPTAGALNSLKSAFNTIEEHTVTQIGGYFTERDAFKARRIGNSVQILSYVNITTQVPGNTEFAYTGFGGANGSLLFISDTGAVYRMISCACGKLRTDAALPTGYYYCVGVALTQI